MRHHGIPVKIVNAVKLLYANPQCKVMCGTNLKERFKITTGVKKGYLLSPILFILAMNLVIKETTKGK